MTVSFRKFYLPVSIEDQLYVEDVGDVDLEPLLFIHGGPGNGCDEKHREAFALSRYRVVLFDQRGCARSEPQGNLHENTTQNLISDIEQIRRRLKIPKWTLVGSSWGAVLALGYAYRFRDSVQRLILKSPFLATQDDISWSYTSTGVAQKLRADWEQFKSNDSVEGFELIKLFAQKVLGSTPSIDYVLRWLNWEGAMYFANRPMEKQGFSIEMLTPYWVNICRLQLHYASNRYFLQDNEIFEWAKAAREKKIPALCLQGDNDFVTPLAHTQKLKALWPEMELQVLEGADHKIPEQRFRGL